MRWTLDDAHTTIGFSARHMGLSTVRGRFTKFEGRIEGDPQDIRGLRGRVEVDMASADTGQEQRDEHLRTSDFFDVAAHPKMIFESTRITPRGDGRYKVHGDLTIRGVTHPVELDYEHAGEGTDPYGNRKIGGTLTGQIKRSDWGLKWNVALETGGWLVSDKIKLEIDFQATQDAAGAGEEAEQDARLSA